MSPLPSWQCNNSPPFIGESDGDRSMFSGIDSPSHDAMICCCLPTEEHFHFFCEEHENTLLEYIPYINYIIII